MLLLQKSLLLQYCIVVTAATVIAAAAAQLWLLLLLGWNTVLLRIVRAAYCFLLMLPMFAMVFFTFHYRCWCLPLSLFCCCLFVVVAAVAAQTFGAVAAFSFATVAILFGLLDKNDATAPVVAVRLVTPAAPPLFTAERDHQLPSRECQVPPRGRAALEREGGAQAEGGGGGGGRGHILHAASVLRGRELF